MTLLLLCWEFFKTGLFAVGGGLATLPFLTRMAETHPEWFTTEMLANMVAVSESTPGPIGIKMAAYAGYTAAGFAGEVLVTLALVLPSVAIIMLISKALSLYRQNRYVNGAFSALQPAVTGLISAAAYSLLRISVWKAGTGIQWLPCLFFALFLGAMQWKKLKKLHPIVYIAAGAAVGILLKFN